MNIRSPLLLVAGTLSSSLALATVPMVPQPLDATTQANTRYTTTENAELEHQLNTLQHQVAELQDQAYYHNQATPIRNLPQAEQQHIQASTPPQQPLPFSAGSIFGNLVVTGPSVGITTHYDGSELIVNSANIYTDYKLLQRKQKEMYELAIEGYGKPNRPHVVLSGNLEGQVSYLNPYRGEDTSDIDLTAAELDSYIEVTPWVNGLMTFTYDNTSTDITPNRTNSSRLRLDRGFITIGNLNKSPIFGSIGQMYVPFGRYSNSTISDPLTKLLGRTKARAVDIGFRLNRPTSPYLTGYVFRPHTSDANRAVIESYGVDAGYTFEYNKITGDLGVGYISTLADADGMQSAGFGGISSGVGVLDCYVGGFDIHNDLSYGPLSLITEFVTATESFSSSDLSYNSGGAHPFALDVEGDYGFNGPWSRPMTFALGYSHSEEAVGLGLPKHRYIAALTTAIERDTLFKIEYRHDVDYSSGDTGTIRSSYDGTTFGTITRHGTGCSSNSIIAALDIYF